MIIDDNNKKPAGVAYSFSALPSFRLHVLSGLSERLAELRFQRLFDLRLLEARIIGVVGKAGSLPFKHVCRDAELEKSNASRLVNRLIERGYLRKLADSADQRSFFLALTEAGKVLHRRLHAEATRRNERWLSVLDAGQHEALNRILDVLLEQSRRLLQEEIRADGLSLEAAPCEPGESLAPATAAGADGQAGDAPSHLRIDAALASRLYELLGTALGKEKIND